MSNEILKNLEETIISYSSQGAANWTRKAIREGIDPIKLLDVMTVAIRQIGDGFGRGELFLPDLVGAADAMSAATPLIKEEIKRRGLERKSLGTIVIGTVYGDIHNIGKTMVVTLLQAAGFDVNDLGINVSAETFLAEVKRYKPDILAMSALITVTALEQRKVIEALKREGLRENVKVMVGGGAITQEFADNIGADGYDPTAPGAVELARKLIKKGSQRR